MEDVFLQESCIGFTNGAFFKTALICRLGSESSPTQGDGDVEMVEEDKSPVILEQKRLEDANISRLEKLMQKEQSKPIKERRLNKKNIIISSYCQVEEPKANGEGK